MQPLNGGIGEAMMLSIKQKEHKVKKLKTVMRYAVKLLKTKTMWVNVLGGIAQIVNASQGELIPVELAVAIQTIINVAVRTITKKPVEEK